MIASGVFVTLYDLETLFLYLSQGVFGSHMTPVVPGGRPNRVHYPTLADYSCVRPGTHIFFFLKRKIYYGGQAIGRDGAAAVFLNGQLSPAGMVAGAPLVWDESSRREYRTGELPGTFTVPRGDQPARTVCQPYLLRFETNSRLWGRTISSDDLYFELGKYPYPLPSNAITGMSFCTLSPAEVSTLLTLFEQANDGNIARSDAVSLMGEPTLLPRYQSLAEIPEGAAESEIEAQVVAEDAFLRKLCPGLPDRIVRVARQVPISPFKPQNIDQADIALFHEPLIRDGSVPNVIIELKKDVAGKAAVDQVNRYLRWLHRIIPEEAERVELRLVARSFTATEHKFEYPAQSFKVLLAGGSEDARLDY